LNGKWPKRSNGRGDTGSCNCSKVDLDMRTCPWATAAEDSKIGSCRDRGGQQDREQQGSPTSTQNTQATSTSSNSTGSLGRWVQEQREQKRLWDQGKPSSMTMERVTMLEGVGFCWDSDEKVLNEQQLRQVLRHQPPGKIAVSDHRSAYTNSKEVYSTNIAGAGSGSISRSPIKREFLSTRDPVPSHSESSSSSGGSHRLHHSQKMIPPVATTQKKSSCKKYDEDEEDGKPFHIDRTKVNEKQSPEEKNYSSDNKKKRKLQETVISSRPQSAQKIVHSKGSPGPTQSQSSQSNVDFRITKNSLGRQNHCQYYAETSTTCGAVHFHERDRISPDQKYRRQLSPHE